MLLSNKHSKPCHEEWSEPKDSRWRKKEVLDTKEMRMQREGLRSPHNRHASACSPSPDDLETQLQWAATSASKRSSRSPSKRSSGTATPRTPLKTVAVSTLNMTKVLRNAGSDILHVDMEIKWCLSLQKEFETLATQSPMLQTVRLTVTDPDDQRWAAQSPVLDLAGCAARFPSLTSLALHAVPIPEIRVAGRQLPRLRHLELSNSGHLLRRPAHKALQLGPFAELEALQICEMAVSDPLDLGALAACSPRLRLLQLTELWGVGPSQPAAHRLVLPACRVLALRDSVSPLELDLWAPRLTECQLLAPGLTLLKIGPGGPAHKAKKPSAPASPSPESGGDGSPSKPGSAGKGAAAAAAEAPLPAARLTLLRNHKLDSGMLTALSRHAQVGEIAYDDAAEEAMAALRQELVAALVHGQDQGQGKAAEGKGQAAEPATQGPAPGPVSPQPAAGASETQGPPVQAHASAQEQARVEGLVQAQAGGQEGGQPAPQIDLRGGAGGAGSGVQGEGDALEGLATLQLRPGAGGEGGASISNEPGAEQDLVPSEEGASLSAAGDGENGGPQGSDQGQQEHLGAGYAGGKEGEGDPAEGVQGPGGSGNTSDAAGEGVVLSQPAIASQEAQSSDAALPSGQGAVGSQEGGAGLGAGKRELGAARVPSFRSWRDEYGG